MALGQLETPDDSVYLVRFGPEGQLLLKGSSRHARVQIISPSVQGLPRVLNIRESWQGRLAGDDTALTMFSQAGNVNTPWF